MFDLPVSTSANRMYAAAGGGRVRISDEYRAWKTLAGQHILAQRPKMTVRHLPLDRPYAIKVLVAATDAADIDNRVKTLLDLLRQMRMTPDDKLLWEQSIRRCPSVAVGLMRVTVWTVDAADMGAA